MAKILQMLFNLDVAVTGLKNLQLAEQQFRQVSDAGQKLNALQKQMGAFQNQQTAVASAASKLDTLRQKLDTARTATQNARLASASLNVQYAQAQNKVAALTAQFGRKSIQVKQARQDMLQLKQAYQQSEAEVKRLAREEQGLESQVKRAGEALTSERDKLAQMKQGLKDAGITTRNFAQRQQEMEKATARLASAQERYNNIKSQLSYSNFKADLLKSAGLALALKAPVNASMKFEQAMNDVAAVARPTAEEFTRLQTQAKFLGRTTQYTAVQAAEAQQNLIRSGMSVDQVIKAMPSVLQLASAEGLNIEDAGRFVAKGLGGMNLGGEMAARLTDVLSYTSAHSNTDVTMLAEAFKVAAPTLSSQSYTMEQVAAYLGILANKGFEGSEAGNALSSSIQRLATMPKQAREAFGALKLSPRDQKGNALQLPDLMIKLYNRLKDKTEVQQLEYLSLIFGKNYGKQMIAFMRATAEGQTKTLENGVWNESFGWSKQSTDIRLNSLNGDMVALGSAWDGLMTRIGESLSPAVRKLTQWLTDAINWVTGLIDRLGPLGDMIVQVGAGIAAWNIISTVYHYASLLVQLPFAKMGVHLAESAMQAALAGQSVSTMTGALGAAQTASSTLGAIWTTIAGPLGVLVTLAAALYMNWESVSKWAEKAGQAIQSIDTNKYEAAKSGTLKRSDPDYGIAVMTSTYMPPSIAHASGGILTSPHIGLVAEAGPEAIIPLSKPQLGVPLLERAASILGMRVSNVTDKKSEISSSQTERVLSFSRNFSPVTHSSGGIFGLTSSLTSISQSASNWLNNSGLTSSISSVSQSASNLLNESGITSTLSSITQGTANWLSTLGLNSLFSSSQSSNSESVMSFMDNSSVSKSADEKSEIHSTLSNTLLSFSQKFSSLLSNSFSGLSSFFSSLTQNENSYSLRKAGDFFASRSDSYSGVHNYSGAVLPERPAPVINITVNASSSEPQSLAEDIASKVREVLREISSMEERASFA